MTFAHNDIGFELVLRLGNQRERPEYRVRHNVGHVRRSAESYFIPDVFVVPVELTLALRDRRDLLEAYSAPLPLVVEIWSPSTGEYDVDTKIPEYQARGDLEIWRLHLYDHTIRAWRRQPDGSYDEVLHTGGTIHPVALPNVAIDLDTLFD